ASQSIFSWLALHEVSRLRGRFSPNLITSFLLFFFFFNDAATTEIYTLSLHDALPIFAEVAGPAEVVGGGDDAVGQLALGAIVVRSEEHTSELQSRGQLVCRLLLEKKNMRNEPSLRSCTV